MATALTMEGIEKSFGASTVLTGVDFAVEFGEVHSLVGENGAGKSTLVKILQGLYIADAGHITVDGVQVKQGDRVPAKDLGIGMVFQEFSLVPSLTVSQNIFLSDDSVNRFGLVNDREAKKRAEEIFAQMGVTIDVNQVMEKLPTAQWQLTEIAKALVQDVRILILDEPTASLAQNEAKALFGLIERLKGQNIAIIYISHRMDEIYQIADRITVLRDGKKTLTDSLAALTPAEIVEAIIGRRHGGHLARHDRSGNIADEVLLEVTDLSLDGFLTDVSFNLRRGEILGLAGLMGSGRTELVQALFGLTPLQSGDIRLGGKLIHPTSPKKVIKKGFALIPEDRRAQGLVLDHSVRENMTLTLLGQFSQGGFTKKAKEREIVARIVEQLAIKLAYPEIRVNTLSGGNQQKVVIGKWLGTQPVLLLMDEPTAGVDIGTKSEILDLIRAIADSGTSVIFVSSELLELLSVSDRILVLKDGTILHDLNPADLQSEEELQLAVQGVSHV